MPPFGSLAPPAGCMQRLHASEQAPALAARHIQHLDCSSGVGKDNAPAVPLAVRVRSLGLLRTTWCLQACMSSSLLSDLPPCAMAATAQGQSGSQSGLPFHLGLPVLHLAWRFLWNQISSGSLSDCRLAAAPMVGSTGGRTVQSCGGELVPGSLVGERRVMGGAAPAHDLRSCQVRAHHCSLSE